MAVLEKVKAITTAKAGEHSSVLPNPELQPKLVEHPLIAAWVTFLEEAAAQGGSKVVKQLWNVPTRFLIFVVQECGINYSAAREEAAMQALERSNGRKDGSAPDLPTSVVSKLSGMGGALAQQFLNQWTAAYPTTAQSALSIMRRFLKYAKEEGILQNAPQFLSVPGVRMRFKHPMTRDWLATTTYSELTRKNLEGTWNGYFDFIARQKGFPISPEQEVAAWEALKARQRQAADGSPVKAAAQQTESAIEAACFDAGIWASAYAKELASRVSASKDSRGLAHIQSKLSSLRQGYTWLKGAGYSDFDPQEIVNPIASDYRLPEIALINWWTAEGDNESRQSTRQAHNTLATGFLTSIAHWKKIRIDPEKEKAALTRLKERLAQGTGYAPPASPCETVTDAFLAEPQKCIDHYAVSLRRSGFTPNARILRLSTLSRFRDGLCVLGVFKVEDMPNVPTASDLGIRGEPSRKRLRKAHHAGPHKAKTSFLAWDRLGPRVNPGAFEFGPHRAESERRVVAGSERAVIFGYKRDVAIRTLVREGTLTIPEAENLRCWQVDLRRGAIATCSRKNEAAWQRLSPSGLEGINDYLSELSQKGNLSRTRLWRKRGWNAPFFVANDGGAYTVDDARHGFTGSDQERLERAIYLRGLFSTMLIRGYNLEPGDVAALEGPLVIPHPNAAAFGTSQRLILAFRSRQDAKLLEDFCRAAKGTPLEYSDDLSTCQKFLKAADGGPLTGDYRS